MRRKRANVLSRIEERMRRIEARAKARRREELRNAPGVIASKVGVGNTDAVVNVTTRTNAANTSGFMPGKSVSATNTGANKTRGEPFEKGNEPS